MSSYEVKIVWKQRLRMLMNSSFQQFQLKHISINSFQQNHFICSLSQTVSNDTFMTIIVYFHLVESQMSFDYHFYCNRFGHMILLKVVYTIYITILSIIWVFQFVHSFLNGCLSFFCML